MSEEAISIQETIAPAETDAMITGDASPDHGAPAESQKSDPVGESVSVAEDTSGNGDAAITGNEQQPDVIDWEKITDDEYLGKVKLPDGQQWNPDVMKEYTKLLKENKIDPKLFEKFIVKDIEIQNARYEERKAERDKQMMQAKAEFKAAGEEFRKTYSPEQVKEMNATLSKIDDPTFRTLIAKSPLANNKTMGKMLLAYEQVYGDGKVRGAAGSGDGGEKTFEEVWTGR